MNPPNKFTQVVRTLKKLIQSDRKIMAINEESGKQMRSGFTKEKQNRNVSCIKASRCQLTWEALVYEK